MNSPLDEHVPFVFVDTNAFYPVRLADLILSSVDDGLFELCVSDHLLGEIERVLVNSKGLPPDKAKTFRDGADFIVTDNTRDFITTWVPDGTETPTSIRTHLKLHYRSSMVWKKLD